jgi:hypothetical protein
VTLSTAEPPDTEPLPIAGRVHVHWYGPKNGTDLPAVFAEIEVYDADTGEPLIGGTAITIRCAPDVHDSLIRAEITELVDTEGSPLRRGRRWSGTDDTVTSTYLLAGQDRPRRDFGWALAQLRAGRRVSRKGWNGPDQWLVLVPGSTITIEAHRPLGQAAPELVGHAAQYAPHIDIRTVQGTIVPWFASQTDALAEDWFVVPGETTEAERAAPTAAAERDGVDPHPSPDREC